MVISHCVTTYEVTALVTSIWLALHQFHIQSPRLWQIHQGMSLWASESCVTAKVRSFTLQHWQNSWSFTFLARSIWQIVSPESWTTALSMSLQHCLLTTHDKSKTCLLLNSLRVTVQQQQDFNIAIPSRHLVMFSPELWNGVSGHVVIA